MNANINTTSESVNNKGIAIIGRCTVDMWKNRYRVWVEMKDGNGAMNLVAKYDDRFKAHRLQYILNGWGLPEFTFPKNVTDDDYSYIAHGVLGGHVFNRKYECEAIRPICELKAKAEADLFKAIIARINDESKRESLKNEWIAKYHESMSQEPVRCW